MADRPEPPTIHEPPGEFEQIARLYGPLTEGSPEALGLKDDVAVLAGRPGFDVVLTKDAMVAGVHFLPDEPLDRVARKLLRVNLSDLAAKAAEPHGYLLAVAWPVGTDFALRARFAQGLAQGQAEFGVHLLGGDTVSTPGPLAASLTLLGWTPAGRLVRRDTARSGDVVLVSGAIGDAGLGLRLLTGELDGRSCGIGEDQTAELCLRHRLPTPRLQLRQILRTWASAAADVSDGLLADAGHIGEASGCGVRIALEHLPVSPAARTWLAAQPDEASARLALATSGDDYEIVCTAAAEHAAAMIDAAANLGVALTVVGDLCGTPGVQASFHGQRLEPARLGWTHP